MQKIRQLLVSLLNTVKHCTMLVGNAARWFAHFLVTSRKGAAAATLALALFFSLFSGITVAYDLIYNGEVIAVVKNKSAFDEAVDLADSFVSFTSIRNYASAPEFSLTLTVSDCLTKPDDIAKQIIEKTESISEADAITVDGVLLGCVAPEDNLSQLYYTYLQGFNPEGYEAQSSFVQNVELTHGYYATDDFITVNRMNDVFAKLNVRTTVIERTRSEIAYSSVTRKSDSYDVGDYVKSVTGVNGVLETAEQTIYIDGVEVSRDILSQTTVAEPVEEVIVIGTRIRAVSGSTAQKVGELGLVWPMQRVSGQRVSAYFGDGRGHKGVDITSPNGTPIYAAQVGTVVVSALSSSYGNYVVVDHGNGYRTLYAHASKRCVSVGETVAQGQVIALVGSTGNSTGNHLHFEVQYNGTQVDPAPFIGLY